MTIRITPITGDSTWQLFNMAKATRAGEALEFEQFTDKLRDAAEPPAADLGVDGEFYVDTDAAILYFKIGGVWTSIGGGSGGSALEIYDDDDDIADAATRLTFTGDGVTVTETAEGSNLVTCLLYTSPSPRDRQKSRMPSSA